MKKLVLNLIVPIFLVTSFISCNKEIQDNSVVVENTQSKETRTLTQAIDMGALAISYSEVKLSCHGTCSCGMLANPHENLIYCDCDPCTLTVYYNDGQANQTINVQDSSVIVPFIEDFTDFAEAEFTDYTIKEIIVYGVQNAVNRIIATEFVYEGDEVEGSIMISETTDLVGMSSTKTEIECNGTCDCREVFDFGNNTASCSCASCTMTVTQVE